MSSVSSVSSVDATSRSAYAFHALLVLPLALPLAMLFATTSACGIDVVLGGSLDVDGFDGGAAPDTATLDASSALADGNLPDAPSSTPFPNGAYDLRIASTSTLALCRGALTGMEGAFEGITRDALGLTEGPIEVVGIDATHLDVRGAPIEIGFLETSLRLEQAGGPGVPPDVWIGIGTRAEDGPLGTLMIGVELEAHQSSVMADGFDGVAGALYIDPSVEDAQCVIGFAARFDAR